MRTLRRFESERFVPTNGNDQARGPHEPWRSGVVYPPRTSSLTRDSFR